MVTKNSALVNDAWQFEGESTDTKPTGFIPVNSIFWELDTGDFYYFDGSTWNKIGGA